MSTQLGSETAGDELTRLRARRHELEQLVVSVDAEIALVARMVYRARGKAIRRCALRGELPQLIEALSGGSVTETAVNARNRAGATALLLAVQTDDNHAVVKALLDAGAQVDRSDLTGNTPLVVAVRPNQLPVVKLLVERAAAVNARNLDGDTPLTNAAIWGSGDIVSYLLEHGADPTMRDGVGLTAAQLARQQDHIAIADELDAAERMWHPSVA